MTRTNALGIVFALTLAPGCGDKSNAGSSPSASVAAPKSKLGSVTAIIGDTKDEISFDVALVDRLSSRASINLIGNCPSVTCADVDDFNAFKAKCPTGKRVEVWLEDVKEGTTIPTGPMAKPHAWVRYDSSPDAQNDLFFDKGFEITKADATTVAGTFSIGYDKPDPGATNMMQVKGGSLKGNFEATICPAR